MIILDICLSTSMDSRSHQNLIAEMNRCPILEAERGLASSGEPPQDSMPSGQRASWLAPRRLQKNRDGDEMFERNNVYSLAATPMEFY